MFWSRHVRRVKSVLFWGSLLFFLNVMIMKIELGECHLTNRSVYYSRPRDVPWISIEYHFLIEIKCPRDGVRLGGHLINKFLENDYFENGCGHVDDSVSIVLKIGIDGFVYILLGSHFIGIFLLPRQQEGGMGPHFFLRGRHETFMTFMVMWNWGNIYSGEWIFHTFF